MSDWRTAAQQALEALDCLEAPPTGAINHYELERRKNALRAALAQPDVPQGWVLVPVEPTEEMTSAGAQSIIDGRDKRPGASWAKEAQMAYAAMLAAAPKGGA